MTPMTDPDKAWSAGVALWCQLWQQQIEQSMQVWAFWASMMPHENARTLSDEAAAMKAAPAPRTPAARKPVVKVTLKAPARRKAAAPKPATAG